MSLEGPLRAGGEFRQDPDSMLLSNFASFPELLTPALIAYIYPHLHQHIFITYMCYMLTYC